MSDTKKGPRRTPLQRERQRLECLNLYLAGEWQCDIAKKLRMSQSQVSRDIKAAHEDWKKLTTYNLDEQKAKRLAEVDNLERMYAQAFRRTVGMHKVETTGTNPSVRKEKMAGAVEFLNGIAWCISERCRILGTYAATKQITAQVPPKLLAAAQIDSL